MPSNGALTVAKFNSAIRQLLPWPSPCRSLASSNATSFFRDHLLVEQLLGVFELQLRELCLGQLGVELCLVNNWDDLEQQLTLLDLLPLLDGDRLEIPHLQGADLDVALRVNLADILLREGNRLRLRVGGRILWASWCSSSS